MAQSIYVEMGYVDRDDYLNHLAEEYEVDPAFVHMTADLLGPDEDFDGLVSMVQDRAEEMW